MNGSALDRLAGAHWLSAARPFFDALDGVQGKTRAVGGIVRDTLLGLPRGDTDIDLATELRPEEVLDRAQKAGLSAHPTGLAHGTVTLVAGEVTAEVTTLREDVETFGRQAKVKFGTDWLRDASRRDFTMNALYAGPGGVLFDPIEGLDDCLAGRVRFIGDPDGRIAEDGLRVYRYFRFVASHGHQQFDTEALAACTRAAGSLDAVSAERVGAEMMRILDLPRIASTLSLMVEAGLFDPHLISGKTVELLARYEDFCAEPALAGRLALVLAAGTDPAGLQERWRLANAVVKIAMRLREAAGELIFGNENAIAYRLGPHKKQAAYVAAALRGGGQEWLAERLDRLGAVEPEPFPIRGSDLVAIGYAPGPMLGAELKRLESVWIDADFELDRAALLAMAMPPDDSSS